MPPLCVKVLGPPDVRHGRQVITLPTRKTLAVLLYLLVEGGSHPRDTLTALFWPDSDDATGRASLRTTLARLREGLGAADDHRHVFVDRNTAGFDFASSFELDLHLLQAAYDLARSLAGAGRPAGEARQQAVAQLQQAADAWRGEFLEGFSLRDAPDFDDWTTMQREAWRKRMEVVLDRLSLLNADAGAVDRAIDTADRWLGLNPLEERAWRRLMRLHFAAGDRVAALRAYDACRAVLDKELGIPPAPATLALADRVRAAPPMMPGPDRPASRRRDASPHERPLVGRADEFTTLVERYHAAGQGRTQVVVLQGEAGIGKTRLATGFLGWTAAQGADVLHGRAVETGAALPYQPLVDALRPRLEHEAAPAALLGPVWLSELSRLFPELRDRDPDLPIPTGDEAAARTRLFEAVVRLGRILSTGAPLVLFVDDVQWADVASLDVLRYAGRRWAQDGAPVLLLFCLRADALATTPALGEWLDGLLRDVALTQIDLGPLSFADTLQLVQSLEAEPSPEAEAEALARWIFAETQGQPFYVVETLRTLGERGALAPNGAVPARILPPSVRQVIHARLAPLTGGARDLLAAGAVLGQGFSFESLCAVGRLTEDEALAALDAVLQRRLLRETARSEDENGAGRYDFAHDKIRDVVHAEASEARRRVFHRRAMETLEAAGAPAAELARHALAAGLDEPALRFSIAAGDAALRLLAARDASAHYERAMAIAERLGQRERLADLHARRGHAFVSMAMWPQARRELEAALAGFGPGEQERYAEILTDVAEACWWMLDTPAIERYAAEALRLAGPLGRGDLEMKAMAWLAATDGAMGNLASSVAQNQRVIDRARALGIAPPAIAGHYQPITLYWLGRLEESLVAGREAVSVAWERNDLSWVVSSLPHVGMTLAATGQYEEATRAFAEARQLGREYGLDTLLARAISMSAGFHLDIFDFAGAETLAREARELALSLNFAPPAVSAGIDLLLGSARRREVGQVDALLDDVAAVAAQTSGFHGWLWRLRLAAARSEIALARDDWEEALRWADDAIAQSRARGRVKYEVIGLIARANALVGLGRAREAIADLQAAVGLARPAGDPALLVRAAAALLAIDGDDALAAEGRAAVAQIAAALPDADAQRRFALAEPVRLLSGAPE